jgi:hypothetical protein
MPAVVDWHWPVAMALMVTDLAPLLASDRRLAGSSRGTSTPHAHTHTHTHTHTCQPFAHARARSTHGHKHPSCWDAEWFVAKRLTHLVAGDHISQVRDLVQADCDGLCKLQELGGEATHPLSARGVDRADVFAVPIGSSLQRKVMPSGLPR